MALAPKDPDRPSADTGGGTPQPPRTPGWVKAFAVAAGILLLVLIVMLLSGGQHGPSRHL